MRKSKSSSCCGFHNKVSPVLQECEVNKMIFINKLVNYLHEKELPYLRKDIIKEKISKWLEKGKESPEINSLLGSPDFSKNFPIWWTGFYVEDPDQARNPIISMRETAEELNGYSSLDTKLTEVALQEQNKMWSSCKNNPKFNFGNFLSETYTKLALINNPVNIGLFLNKDHKDFITSYFFSTEIDLINKHYKKLNSVVNLYILNIKDNCNVIEETINRIVTNIKIICVDNCDPLSRCISEINERKNPQMQNAGKYKKSIKKSKKKKLKKKSKKKKSKRKSR